ncbi:ABC transporter permease subunit [Lentzea sp. BCCO 10_0798]|uniref:ABC transporter permease subunit n=1 Tax=Lentzea kristufekii TaxID=3095430 RepID=A0ABU4U4X8_9PSEU|nr:ABC transporter permease subunit [Lentzea sp. BCCO 10_0798]MDX8055051.1 ABC transporter permease subunit [Lentzea sp. BCCO 10_0798]
MSVQDGGAADPSEGRGPRSTGDVLRSTAWPMFVGLAKVTVPLTALSFAIGLVLALLVALARISPYRVLSGLARAFISVIRGTPLLLQLFIVFYCTAADRPEVPALHGRRRRVLAERRGVHHRLRLAQTLRRIVLPQAARTAVPPLSNTLLSLLKDTSLGSVVLLTELFRESQPAAAESNEFLWRPG